MLAWVDFLRTAAVPRATIGHYAPPGHPLFAYSLQDTGVDWLDPKPVTCAGQAAASDAFAGYLPGADTQ